MKTRLFLSLLLALATISASAQARYVFYFIGDGMGNGHIMGANQYQRLVHSLEQPLLMTTFPVASISTTYSASSPVTDSAAAGTALATGNKTINGMLGVAPDSAAVVSVATRLQKEGYGIGIVTSVAADDATPGAFYTHVPSRKMYYEIGVDAARSGFEFIGGSQMRGWRDKAGNDTGLREEFTRNEVAVVRGEKEAREVQNRRILMLNNDTINDYQLGYTIDTIPGALTLKAMTSTCLDHLMRVSPDRFFMMVEGGNIDWAGHANDGGAVIKEIINFDQTLALAYEFYLKHPDETLIVVTADHDTGGFSVGCQYTGYNMYPGYFDAQRVSKDKMADHVRAMLRSRRVYTWDDIREMLTRDLGFWTAVPVTEAETEQLKDAYEHTFVARDMAEQEALYKNFPYLVQVAYNILQDHAGVGWSTMHHSGNPVPVYAIGVGADLFQGVIDNTEIPNLIYGATRLISK